MDSATLSICYNPFSLYLIKHILALWRKQTEVLLSAGFAILKRFSHMGNIAFLNVEKYYFPQVPQVQNRVY